jgi:hypothetical protein
MSHFHVGHRHSNEFESADTVVVPDPLGQALKGFISTAKLKSHTQLLMLRKCFITVNLFTTLSHSSVEFSLDADES